MLYLAYSSFIWRQGHNILCCQRFQIIMRNVVLPPYSQKIPWTVRVANETVLRTVLVKKGRSIELSIEKLNTLYILSQKKHTRLYDSFFVAKVKELVVEDSLMDANHPRVDRNKFYRRTNLCCQQSRDIRIAICDRQVTTCSIQKRKELILDAIR